MTQATPSFRSIEEYLTFNEGTDRRYELVNGVLIELPTESDLNLMIATFLTVMLSRQIPYYLIRRGTEIFVSSDAVTSRYPDLMVLSEAGLAALEGTKRSLITVEMPAPALVIEIVSPGEPGTENDDRDYLDKRKEYAVRGIPEYWIVDPGRSMVMVLALQENEYREIGQFRGNDRVISLAFPMDLTAEQILRAGR